MIKRLSVYDGLKIWELFLQVESVASATCNVGYLILILHGGNGLESSPNGFTASKQVRICYERSAFEHYLELIIFQSKQSMRKDELAYFSLILIRVTALHQMVMDGWFASIDLCLTQIFVWLLNWRNRRTDAFEELHDVLIL